LQQAPQRIDRAAALPALSRMARLPRIVLPGIPHHVTQRGNRRARPSSKMGTMRSTSTCSPMRRQLARCTD